MARVRGRTLQNRPDILQLYNPGDLHVQVALKEPERYHVAFLHLAWMEERASALGYPPGRVSVFSPQVAHPRIVAAFQSLHAVVAKGSALSRQEALANATLAFFELGDGAGLSGPPRRAPRAVRRAKELLEDRFAEEISLDDLAHEVRLTKEHFSRTFRAELGVPPHQYLMQVRIARARAALAEGGSGAAVAAACGFYDQSHLNRCFRRAMGLTPIQYARALR